ncbi:hypothetical protein N7499_004204 [Penicillium canescens]|nr:hypothetical protein N7499_004204 [Penicillium canescens]KAJ6181476.1 hypothetical protein N7485_000118 [Penicillium canescens]
MGWKIKQTPIETAQAVKTQYTEEQINNGKIATEAIAELLEDTPKVSIICSVYIPCPFQTLTRNQDIYYSAGMIKQWFTLFIIADKNLDGNVTLQELFDLMYKYNFDKADKEKMKEFFEAADYSEDKKCRLAGT